MLKPCKYDIIGDAGIEHLLGLLPKQLLLRPVGIVDDEPGDLREACVRERTCGVDPENELTDDWVLGERGKLLRLRPIAAGASQQRFEGSRRDVGGDSIRIAAATSRQRPPCQQGDSQDARHQLSPPKNEGEQRSSTALPNGDFMRCGRSQ